VNITAPTPFAAARKILAAKKLLPTELGSAELSAIEAGIKRQTIFSAKNPFVNVLQSVFDSISKIVDPTLTGQQPGSYMDCAKAREEIRAAVQATGWTAEGAGVVPGSLQDLTSRARLSLIVDTNVQMIRNQGSFIRGNLPGALDAFPAQELVRTRTSQKERLDWPRRWMAAGGKFFGNGRMIALKNDAVWQALGDGAGGYTDTLSNPYPPFAFGSGMSVRDISMGEALDLVVLKSRDDVPAENPVAKTIRDAEIAPQASTENLAPSLSAALLKSLGDGYEIANGVLRFIRGGA